MSEKTFIGLVFLLILVFPAFLVGLVTYLGVGAFRRIWLPSILTKASLWGGSVAFVGFFLSVLFIDKGPEDTERALFWLTVLVSTLGGLVGAFRVLRTSKKK